METEITALIRRRAAELGIDENTQSEFFWIAEQSLDAPLPEGWRETVEGGIPCYINNFTEVKVDKHPGLDYYKHLFQTLLEDHFHVPIIHDIKLPDFENAGIREEMVSPYQVFR
jgi:hypothetical protein